MRLPARHLTEGLGVEMSKTHVWEVLRGLGIVYERPKAVVRSPDPDYEGKAVKVRGFKRVAPALEKGGLQQPSRTGCGWGSTLPLGRAGR